MNFIPLRRLLDRVSQPPSKARELSRLREQFDTVEKSDASVAEVSSARRLAALRVELISALGAVHSCSNCAKGQSLPHGRYVGGHCCGASTGDLFTDDEVASLSLAGTKIGRLRVPKGDHAGCLFRGPTGCSIDPEDRPNLCVRYTCLELEAELGARPDRRRVVELKAAIRREFEHFCRLRREGETRA